LRGSLRLIPIEDVHYLQAEEKYVVVHHARGEDLIEESLKSLETEFADRFLRIHRNCLVASEEFLELRPRYRRRRARGTAPRQVAAGSQPALRTGAARQIEAPVGCAVAAATR
jgi:two-component system response regulator AlgR